MDSLLGLLFVQEFFQLPVLGFQRLAFLLHSRRCWRQRGLLQRVELLRERRQFGAFGGC